MVCNFAWFLDVFFVVICLLFGLDLIMVVCVFIDCEYLFGIVFGICLGLVLAGLPGLVACFRYCMGCFCFPESGVWMC